MRLSFLRQIPSLSSRLLRISIDYIRGYWAIRHLELPAITILGGVRVKPEDNTGKEAFKLAQSLVQHGYSVITGGGPGIMLLANCGASSLSTDKRKNNQKTIGIGLTCADNEFENPCAHVYKANYFFVRKWFLFHHSSGFVFFPGGVGTVDEFFELLNLIVFNMIEPQCIVLIDKNYWKMLIDWYVKTGMKDNLITLPPYEVFIMVDTAQEALECILNSCQKQTSFNRKYSQ
jgi:uncharacterized protein (TIGR00730 family)